MGLTIKATLNTTRIKNDGTYPIVVRVTHDSTPIKVPTGLCVPEPFWDEGAQEVDKKYKGTTSVPRMNKVIQDLKAKANDVMLQLIDSGEVEELTGPEIKNRILGKDPGKRNMSVFQFVDEIIQGEKDAKKFGNARVYKDLRSKLTNFLGHEQLKFNQVNYRFLKQLEISHYGAGGKEGGLSTYMRTLRATYNKAIKSKVAQQEKYPFKEYKIPKSKPRRRTMGESDFDIFRHAEFKKGTAFYRVHKLYMCSFFLRGMNWMDMAFLQVKDIHDNFQRISYVRRKTKTPFSIKIVPQLKEILIEFMNDYDRHEPDDYVFPIIMSEESEEDQIKFIRDRRLSSNKHLKRIAKQLGIEYYSFYAARHTYANTGKRKGVSVEKIKDGMGHSSSAMTEDYLNSFENAELDEADALIMA